jgi:hypothetical protein
MSFLPVTVAELGGRDRGLESQSGHECLMCVCAFFCVCVVLCLGRVLVTS